MPGAYLVDIPEKEHEIVRRMPNYLGHVERLLRSLDLNPHYCWYLLEAQMSDLVASLKGDVDILAGRLDVSDRAAFAARLASLTDEMPEVDASLADHLAALATAEAGEIVWPPRFDYLVGIEAKCVFLSRDGEMKSTKRGAGKVRGIHTEIQKLLSLGLDKVALLEFIANPESHGVDSLAWTSAAVRAADSLDEMLDTFGARLPEASPAGHAVASIGAVTGDDETARGAGIELLFRQARRNPQLQGAKTQAYRMELQRTLSGLLGGQPQPRWLPAYFINCKPCGRIHPCDTETRCAL